MKHAKSNRKSLGTAFILVGLVLTIYGFYPYLQIQGLIGNIMAQPGGCLGSVDACVEIPLIYQSEFPAYQIMMLLGPLVFAAGVILKFFK